MPFHQERHPYLLHYWIFTEIYQHKIYPYIRKYHRIFSNKSFLYNLFHTH